MAVEESRYFDTLKLEESLDEDDFPPYWQMSDKADLLLNWLGGQSKELQNRVYDDYDTGFITELKENLTYSRGLSGLLPVVLLGDRWKDGVAPKSVSMGDRFLPPPPVSNEPPRMIPLNSSVVPGTIEVCSILAKVQAHGVEKNKGGLSTLVNIIIEGAIGPSKVFGMSQVCVGPMTRELDPSMSAGRHGPFYILTNPAFSEELPDTSKGLSSSYHQAYLVPTSSDARAMEVALDQAAQMGMITDAHAKASKEKILTYQNILSPKSAPHAIATAVLKQVKAL